MTRLLGRLSWAVVVLFMTVVYGSAFTVSEGQQALVIRLGRAVDTITEPGLRFKVPLIDTVVLYDTRLLSLELPVEQIILGDQKRLEVQTFARFHIVNPLQFYQSVRTLEQGQTQLMQIVSASERQALGQVSLKDLLSPKRDPLMDGIRQEVALRAAPLGVTVSEVRLHRADLPEATSWAIYDRMKSERQREAKELRAQGSEWAQEIQAKADRDRTVLLADAQKNSLIIHGQADADAGRILSDAFSKDPAFYQLYRSWRTYKGALADSGPTLILSPDAAFLKGLQTGPGK